MSDSIGPQLLGVSILFLITSWVFVGLRCFVRLRLVKAFFLDDWLMIVSLALFTAQCGLFAVAIHHGLGQHTRALTAHAATNAFKYQMFGLSLYTLCAITIKLSIGLLLLRISQRRRYRYIIWGCMALLVATNLAMFCILIFQCRPINYYWHQFFHDADTLEGSCMDREIVLGFGYLFSAVGITVDWIFALLPIPMLWGVQMKLQVKISVLVILGLGIFASTATCVRLMYVMELQKGRDPIYDITHSLVWIVIEIGIGICAACFATLRPLARHFNMIGFSSSNHVSDYATSKRSTHNGYHVHSSHEHALSSVGRGRNSTKVESEQINMERVNSGWTVSNESQDDILPQEGQITRKVEVDVTIQHAQE